MATTEDKELEGFLRIRLGLHDTHYPTALFRPPQFFVSSLIVPRSSGSVPTARTAILQPTRRRNFSSRFMLGLIEIRATPQ